MDPAIAQLVPQKTDNIGKVWEDFEKLCAMHGILDDALISCNTASEFLRLAVRAANTPAITRSDLDKKAIITDRLAASADNEIGALLARSLAKDILGTAA